MQSKRSKLLKAGIITLVILVGLAVLYGVLYVGYCRGIFGKRSYLLRYVFQCSCPRSWENIRYQRLYSEHAEIMFSACDQYNVGPVPSPSGYKVAVINYKAPAQSYVWFLQTDEKVSFTWPGGGDLIWLSDDFFFVQWGLNTARVMDLNARTEYPIPVRTDVRLADDRITPDVLSALQKAGYVLLTHGEVAAISQDNLDSSEHSFVIPYSEFAYILADLGSGDEKQERMRQFLRDHDIDYLDYVDKRGTDVLSNPYRVLGPRDLVSPDGRFFYKDGIYLVETREKIVDSIPNWKPIAWVYDGVIVRSGTDSLIHILPDMANIGFGTIHYPWLKLRVPTEYNVSGTNPD